MVRLNRLGRMRRKGRTGRTRSSVIGLFRLARPLFLLGGVTFFGLGVAMAIAQGAEPAWSVVALGQLTVIAGQLMTHFSNDYFDRSADVVNATRTPWSGGSLAIVEGDVSPAAARRAMGTTVVIAGLLLAGLVVVGRSGVGPGLPALVALALLLAWAYSSPPARLHARGLGEVIGALLLAIITPMVGLMAAGGHITPAGALTLAPLGLLQFAMLVSVSLPDRRGDAAAGKRTLAVRWGGAAAARAGAGAIGLAFGLAVALVCGGEAFWDDVAGSAAMASGTGTMWEGAAGPVALGYLVWLPLGIYVGRKLVRGWDDAGGWGVLGFWSIGLVMGSAWTTAIGWVVVAGIVE